MIKNICGLYVIDCTANGTRYFGSSQNIARRWRQHRWDLRKGSHANGRLQRTWTKYGEGAFRFSVLAIIEPSDRLETERRLLAIVIADPSTINLSAAPNGGRPGRKHSAASRALMAERKRGTKHSADTLARMRMAQAWRKHRPETSAKLSTSLRAWNAKHPRSDEEKEKTRRGVLAYYERRARENA